MTDHIARSSFNLASPVVPKTSPLTFFDIYEMTDSIRRTMIRTDAAIARDIAAQSMSGNEFLSLSKSDLRKLSKNNDQVFQELRKLQKISIPSLSSRVIPVRDWCLYSIFPEITPLDHHSNNAASSAICGPQIPDHLNHEPFDYGDIEVKLDPNLHAIVDDISLPDHPPQLDALVHPVPENGPSLQADISQVDALINGSSPKNDGLAVSTISSPPIKLTRDSATHLHSAEEAHNAELQSSDELIDADETQPLIPSGSQSANGVDEDSTHLQNDSVLPDTHTPSTTTSSPVLSDPDAATQLSEIPLNRDAPNPHTTPDPNVLPEQDNISRHSSPASVPPSQLTPELENALEPPRLPTSELADTLSSLDDSLLSLPLFLDLFQMSDLKLYNPLSNERSDVDEGLNGQIFETPRDLNALEETPDDTVHKVDSNTGFKDPRGSSTQNESIEPCRSPPLELQSAASSSTDETPEDYHGHNSDKVLHSDPQYLEDSDNEESIYMNVLATFTLPADIIPVTPPGSPVLDGLSHYMIFPGSEAPSSVLRADQDNISTPVERDISTGERTLWPPSETPRFGLLLSSGNGQSLRNGSPQQASDLPESQGSDVDVTIQPDLPSPPHMSHVQVQDSHPGTSTSPFERMQSGLLRVIPTLFALDRKTIDRTT